jgi:hypothetical protein
VSVTYINENNVLRYKSDAAADDGEGDDGTLITLSTAFLNTSFIFEN